MSRFACPNPSCSFVFDAAQIPAGVTLLACPLCHIQFPYQPPTPPPPTDDQGNWNAPAPGYADANQHARNQDYPQSEYDQPNATASDYQPPPMITAAPRKPSGGFFNSTMFVSMFFLLASGILIVMYFTVRKGDLWRPEKSNVVVIEDKNFSYAEPGGDWILDSTVREEMKANIFALTYPDSDRPAWVAMAAKDYETREPRRREIKAGLRSRLNRYFTDLESNEIEDATWAGLPAVGYYFSGNVADEAMEGACYAMTYKGIAYWFFAWAPQGTFNDMADEFKDLRERVKILDLREGWEPSMTEIEVFTTAEGEFQLTDTMDVWNKVDIPPKDLKFIDDNAVMELRAVHKVKRDFRPPEANLTVFELPEANEKPLEQAREHVLNWLNKEVKDLGATITFHPVEEALPRDIDEPDIPILRLRSENSVDPDRRRYHVIAAQELGGKLVVVDAACDTLERELWEPFLISIVGSLEERGSGGE